MLYGDTFMDNFDMEKFMEKLGVTGVVWGQSEHGSEYNDEEVEPCDELCDNCQLRFACYTNKWMEKGEQTNEKV